MDQQFEPAQQVTDLRLHFFPVPSSTPAEVPGRTRLIENPTAGVADSVIRRSFYVQCDCACK
jgi:hypothetical protein